MDIFRLDSPAAAYAPVALDLTPIAPPPAVSGPAPKTLSAPPNAFTHLFGGLNQASQTVASASPGNWRLRWSAALQPEFGTFGLLAADDRVMAVGRLLELIDGDGHSLYHALTGGALPGLFPEAKAWLTMDPVGNLQRRSLSSGELEFFQPSFGGDDYAYTFVGLNKTSYLLAGTERQLDPHGKHLPKVSQIQHLKVAPPFEVDPDDRLLIEVDGGERLKLNSLVFLPVSRGDRLVIASQNLLLVSDYGLVPRRGYIGDFTPLAISLDDSGGMHLIVRTGRSLRYWLVSQEGRRLRDVVLPTELPERVVPPVVSLDGRAFVHLKDRLLVIGGEGTQQASVPFRDPAARAVAQPDGSLLIADGTKVWHLGKDLRATLLAEFGGDPFRSPAVAVSADRIYVATNAAVHCFERTPSR